MEILVSGKGEGGGACASTRRMRRKEKSPVVEITQFQMSEGEKLALPKGKKREKDLFLSKEKT